mmetsp:Transcript_28620/g.69325  ORF Transcript_28620/g.69325 Transcript_28620/m.69325 type:complete len:276 (-) Transcript_28620:2275-3102(-)
MFWTKRRMRSTGNESSQQSRGFWRHIRLISSTSGRREKSNAILIIILERAMLVVRWPKERARVVRRPKERARVVSRPNLQANQVLPKSSFCLMIHQTTRKMKLRMKVMLRSPKPRFQQKAKHEQECWILPLQKNLFHPRKLLHLPALPRSLKKKKTKKNTTPLGIAGVVVAIVIVTVTVTSMMKSPKPSRFQRKAKSGRGRSGIPIQLPRRRLLLHIQIPPPSNGKALPQQQQWHRKATVPMLLLLLQEATNEKQQLHQFPHSLEKAMSRNIPIQ